MDYANQLMMVIFGTVACKKALSILAKVARNRRVLGNTCKFFIVTFSNLPINLVNNHEAVGHDVIQLELGTKPMVDFIFFLIKHPLDCFCSLWCQQPVNGEIQCITLWFSVKC
jgi:hypothetical protein